jgi:hypothetical protein
MNTPTKFLAKNQIASPVSNSLFMNIPMNNQNLTYFKLPVLTSFLVAFIPSIVFGHSIGPVQRGKFSPARTAKQITTKSYWNLLKWISRKIILEEAIRFTIIVLPPIPIISHKKTTNFSFFSHRYFVENGKANGLLWRN